MELWANIDVHGNYITSTYWFITTDIDAAMKMDFTLNAKMNGHKFKHMFDTYQQVLNAKIKGVLTIALTIYCVTLWKKKDKLRLR